mgnify:CR=1 FL=1
MNPRAAINDLLPFQGSPFSLLGTSPNKLTNKRYSISIPVDTAEKVGFEPTAPCGVTGFKTSSLNHSDTSPLRYPYMEVSRDNRYIIISKAKMSTTNFTFFQKNLNNYGTSNFMGCSGHPQYLKVPERQYTFPYRHALSVVSTI